MEEVGQVVIVETIIVQEEKISSMKKYYLPIFLGLSVVSFSCSSPKTYFTSGIRDKVERSHQPLEKIQFYADRNIVLQRELKTGETKVASGEVRIENGHYINTITLKKNTPGVCTVVKNNVLGISFEIGEHKTLTFGKTKNASMDDPYRILANEWVDDFGLIEYDGKPYHILSAGTEAGILIKTSILRKSKIEEREMKGRKVSE